MKPASWLEKVAYSILFLISEGLIVYEFAYFLNCANSIALIIGAISSIIALVVVGQLSREYISRYPETLLWSGIVLVASYCLGVAILSIYSYYFHQPIRVELQRIVGIVPGIIQAFWSFWRYIKVE